MASLGQEVDPFATHQTSHSPLWLSLNNPALLGLDAMVQTWPRLRLYAFPPIALLTGVLERVRRDGVHLLLKPRSGRAEYGSLTWFLSLAALHGGFPSGGISSHWQRAWSFTPAWSCGSCGCGSWGGTTHSLWSLNWGCWDHPPI